MLSFCDSEPFVDLEKPIVIVRIPLLADYVTRQVERRLADLCADHDLDVLDGRVLSWPSGAFCWRHRALYNIPLLAPLPSAVWEPLASSSGVGQPSRVLAQLLPGLTPGVDALCALCSIHDPATLQRLLTQIADGVSTTPVSLQQLGWLRRLASGGS